MTESGSSRRDFMKKAAYTAPLVLTMNVSLAQARSGSGFQDGGGDCEPSAAENDCYDGEVNQGGGGGANRRRGSRNGGNGWFWWLFS